METTRSRSVRHPNGRLPSRSAWDSTRCRRLTRTSWSDNWPAMTSVPCPSSRGIPPFWSICRFTTGTRSTGSSWPRRSPRRSRWSAPHRGPGRGRPAGAVQHPGVQSYRELSVWHNVDSACPRDPLAGAAASATPHISTRWRLPGVGGGDDQGPFGNKVLCKEITATVRKRL